MVGWVGSGLGVVVGRHAGQIQEGLLACAEMLEHFTSATDDTRSHRLPGVQLWIVSTQN